jgi:hypothetical protein
MQHLPGNVQAKLELIRSTDYPAYNPDQQVTVRASSYGPSATDATADVTADVATDVTADVVTIKAIRPLTLLQRTHLWRYFKARNSKNRQIARARSIYQSHRHQLSPLSPLQHAAQLLQPVLATTMLMRVK